MPATHRLVPPVGQRGQPAFPRHPDASGECFWTLDRRRDKRGQPLCQLCREGPFDRTNPPHRVVIGLL